MSDAPPFVLAHSMGAHILLRTLHDRPQAFRAAVLTAPMIAVSTRGYPGWLARIVTALYSGSGRAANSPGAWRRAIRSWSISMGNS